MTSFRFAEIAGALTAALSMPPFAHAQTPPTVATEPPATQAAPSAAPFTAGWQDGFFVQSASGDFRLQFGLLLQADERWAVDDPQNNIVNTFAFRRIRPILQGRVAGLFDFYVNPDFAGGAVNIRDAYVETRFSPAFRIRVGKGKEPFGLERLHSSSYLTFVERSLPTAVAPDRDIGVQVLGDIAGVVSYAAGVFNGVVDGGSVDADTNDGKDLVGRVVVRPFVKRTGTPLAGLGLALAGSTGSQPTGLPSFASSGRQTFFRYDGPAAGEGTRNRFSPQWFYYYRNVGTFGEYIDSRGRIARNTVSEDITHKSFVVAGSVVVTGEAASERGVRPRNVFDPSKRTWGALQIAARYHSLSIDPKAITLGFAAAGASRDAKSLTIGANWYMNTIMRWVLNFERTAFDGDPDGWLEACRKRDSRAPPDHVLK